MIPFFPEKTESILFEQDKDALLERLEHRIRPVKEKDQEEEQKEAHLFNGIWNERGFSISLKLKIANNFVPVMNGEFLDADVGVLIKISYQLFPATKRLLLFWTVLTFLISLFFVGIYQAWLYGAISFGICLVNYIISREHFFTQVRKSRRALERMLS